MELIIAENQSDKENLEGDDWELTGTIAFEYLYCKFGRISISIKVKKL